jgi:tetratricopeptide (TPR) repeat protein
MSMKRIWLSLMLLACAVTAPAQQAGTDALQMLQEAVALIHEGQYRLAIGNKLDPVIQAFEAEYKDSGKHIYGARSGAESLYYLALASATSDEAQQNRQSDSTVGKAGEGEAPAIEMPAEGVGGSTQDTLVINSIWGDALFIKGSALVSLKEYAEAEQVLAEAIALSPMNSMYLSEYAYVFLARKQWLEGLAWAQKAEEAASFSPESDAKGERGLALRHMGFAQIELGRLDEAEKTFKAALKLDRNDAKAKHELEYIKQMRARQKTD